MDECDDKKCTQSGICDDGLEFLREAVVEGQVAAAAAPTCLLSLGLLQPLAGAPELVTVVPPSSAAAVTLLPYERAVAEAARRVTLLKATFERVQTTFNAARQELAPDTITLRGLDTINRVVDAAVMECTTELMTAQPGGSRPPEILDALLARSLETISRGIRQRTIYQHAVRSHRPTLEYIVRVMAAGAEIRTVDKVFDRLIICDRRVCFIPDTGNGDETALEIRNPGLVAFLCKVFDHHWDRGIAVDGSGGFRPDVVLTDIERSVGRMIVSGSTEDKIARNLGISRRTVAEYASRLARHLGSTSRAQLGYLIATHGLLDDAPADRLPMLE